MVEVVARLGGPTRHLQGDDLAGLHRDDEIRIAPPLSEEIDPGHPALRLLQGPVRLAERRYGPISRVADHERAEMEAGPVIRTSSWAGVSCCRIFATQANPAPA